MSWGAALAAVGFALHLTLWPLNKNLWTGSFVLYTAGLALLLIGICYYLVELHGRKTLLAPFMAAGTNPTIIYLGAEVMAFLLGRKWFAGNMSLRKLAVAQLEGLLQSPYLASLAWPLLLITFWLVVGTALHRRGIVFKV